MLKRTSNMKKNDTFNFLDGTWLIHSIVGDKLMIFNNSFKKKRVKFSDNIEVNHIENNKIVKSNDLMNKYIPSLAIKNLSGRNIVDYYEY